MAVDKNKIIAEATRLVQKGQFDKALRAYEKILAEDRKEVRILLKVGELHQKKGDNAAAAATFNQVAEIYGDQGFFLKAVAVYKQIAKLTPEDVRVNERLAGLYQQLGLLNDATGQLQVVATAYEKSGDQGKHLDVLRRLLDLDPENVVTCQRLGDLYAKAGRSTEALELYRRAAAHLRENKRSDEHLKLAERIYQLTPDDMKLARELAQEYLARGDTKKALGKLQACHGADKQDVDTLRLMAQAFRDLGQVSKTIAVYRALARVYAERGRKDDAAITWRQVLDLLPDDPEATDELGSIAGPRPAAPRAAAAPPPGRPPGASPVQTPPPAPAPTPPPTRTTTAVRPGPAAFVPAATPAPVAAPPVASPSPIGRILTEADVYLKYGLHQKALDHVQKILADDPDHPDALERVRDIRDAAGDRVGAAEAAERVVQALLARGGEGRLDHAIERLRALDPAHAEVSVAGAPAARGEEAESPARDELPPAEPAPSPLASEARSGIEDELPLPDDEPLGGGPEAYARPVDEVEEVVVLSPAEDDLEPPGSPEVEARERVDVAPPEPVEALVPEPVDAPVPEPIEVLVPEPVSLAPPSEELGRDQALIPPEDQGPAPVLDDERPAIALEDEALPPAPPSDLEVEIEAADFQEPPAPPASVPVEAPPEEVDMADLEEIEEDAPEVEATPTPPPLPVPDRASPMLQAEMEELEFYERQGLLDEAVLAVQELAAAHPGHPEVEKARARIEGLLGGAGVTPAAPQDGQPVPPEAAAEEAPAEPTPPEAYGSTGTTGIFDLGAELSAELGPELAPTPTGEFQYSVADVFDQFKRGLEKTVRPDDSATKYDLGIAFQEMGMLDEALEQFRSALAGGDRRREVEILNMIGICLGMKGQYRDAVETYRQALRSEFLSGDAARALHFELGAAHEALGEPDVAVWYFQKIAQGNPGYRGAGERVKRLGGGPGTPPEGAGAPAPGSGGDGPGQGSPGPAREPGRKNAGSR